MDATLRLSDLEHRGTKPESKLMNAKVPDTVLAGIARVAAELGCSKTAAVIALLNEGLDALTERGQDSAPAPRVARPRRGRPPRPVQEVAAG